MEIGTGKLGTLCGDGHEFCYSETFEELPCSMELDRDVKMAEDGS
jgi:hypothetical protein